MRSTANIRVEVASRIARQICNLQRRRNIFLSTHSPEPQHPCTTACGCCHRRPSIFKHSAYMRWCNAPSWSSSRTCTSKLRSHADTGQISRRTRSTNRSLPDRPQASSRYIKVRTRRPQRTHPLTVSAHHRSDEWQLDPSC